MKMKRFLFSLGITFTLVFGGSFLIRLIRDGEFYIAEFTAGLIGIVLVLTGTLVKKNTQKARGRG
ncbi:hypothetical protein QTG56_02105 [Rossellomorea sp. AcN35-11]|nr:hypothetical protein [Rossellomorea aquimaris]WJV29978.1 hypothetical protein QTG56_02105 [Rossellomorea sp. AcN35-11]